MISLGVFEKEELETACLAANVVCPQENLGEGLTLQVIDGIRTWSSSTSRGDVITQGVPATFEGKYTLSPRFVHEADCLASEGNPVEIRIENGHAFASNDFGLFSMILGNKESNVSPIDGDNLTTIEISQKALHHILHFGSCDPAAFIPESELAKVPNVSKLSILEESIGIHSFFDEIGCNRTGSFQKASVCGPIGEFVVDRMMCNRVSKFLNSAEKLEIKISLDINNGNVVQFAGANWKILLHRVNTGAARYYNELVDVLRQSDLFFLEGIDSSICVQHAGQSRHQDLAFFSNLVVSCRNPVGLQHRYKIARNLIRVALFVSTRERNRHRRTPLECMQHAGWMRFRYIRLELNI
jgi:hypothetical protein